MKLRKYIYTFATAILTSLAVTSCISHDTEQFAPDKGEPGQPKSVSLSIAATPFGNSTRATATFPEHPAEANELIQDWFVAIVDESGEVVAIDQGDSQTGVWNDVVNVEIELYRRYTAFAFANFNNANSEVENSKAFATALGFSKIGDKIDVSEIKNSVYSGAANKDYLSSEDLIPMAGYLEFTPKGTVNETFAIEVVRLFSRVEFAFVKQTENNIAITNIALQPVNIGSEFLMPNYDEKPVPNDKDPENKPSLPEGAAYKSTPININIENSNVPFNNVEDGKETDFSERHRFYIKESIAEGHHETNHFHITLGITRDNGEMKPYNDKLYALAENTEHPENELKFFYRNDYVLFPIVITDYVPKIEIRSYPPIGGYPANVLDNNDGNYYATFETPERFEIYPYLLDGNKRIPVGDIMKVELDYDENNKLFGKLEKDGQTNVYYADLNDKISGTVPVTVTFTYKDTSNNINYQSKRTVYIIRK